jgi:hypothetical protein
VRKARGFVEDFVAWIDSPTLARATLPLRAKSERQLESAPFHAKQHSRPPQLTTGTARASSARRTKPVAVKSPTQYLAATREPPLSMQSDTLGSGGPRCRYPRESGSKESLAGVPTGLPNTRAVVARNESGPRSEPVPWYRFGTGCIVHYVQIVHGRGRIGRFVRSRTYRHPEPLGWGPKGRWFKSSRPDYTKPPAKLGFLASNWARALRGRGPNGVQIILEPAF